jgi:hypothetical protein
MQTPTRPRAPLLVLIAFLTTVACGSTREVWRHERDVSLAMMEDASVEGPSGVERAGPDTYLRFRNRVVVLDGFDDFRGTVSLDHIELMGQGLEISLDEDGLRIAGDGVDLSRSLSQLPKGKIVRFTGGELVFTEQPPHRWDRQNRVQ